MITEHNSCVIVVKYQYCIVNKCTP